jgi:hypothetical protein
MADMIEIVRGARPWAPGPGSELIETYDYWDRPLAGLIRQHGQLFLFDCLAGVVEEESLWAYTPVVGTVPEELRMPNDDIRRAIRREMRQVRDATFVLEREGDGIVAAIRAGGDALYEQDPEDSEKLELAIRRHESEAELPIVI